MLPVSGKGSKNNFDVVIVSGDAYIDHPSFGAAVVGNLLKSYGLRVGIIPQPDWHGTNDFKVFGKPNIFFGITAGCVDSMVANYTPLRKKRKKDSYAEGGKAGLRPDRACIVYTNRIREAFKDAFVILGGVEASSRKLAHYDFWDDSLRRSILIDSGANLILYGPVEGALLPLLEWLKGGRDIYDLFSIGSIVFSIPAKEISRLPEGVVFLPSFEEIRKDKELLREAQIKINKFSTSKILVQKHDERLVVHTPPAVISENDLDTVYSLSFSRKQHPIYKFPVPALEVVQNSITGHRGCIGDCSFCILSICQGKKVISRSEQSILNEAKWLSSQKFFRGTITDIGGPTANMYKIKCKKNLIPNSCINRNCLYPRVCPNLIVDHSAQMRLIKKIKEIPNVKHVFLNSGVRHDLVVLDPGYFEFLFKEDIICGQLSVAPEHVSERVLKLMRKPPPDVWERFKEEFARLRKRYSKDYYFVPYFILSFPGSNLEDAFVLSREIQKYVKYPLQLQDFTPLPLSDASCMYYTEKDMEGNRIFIAKTYEEKLMQRGLVQFRNPAYSKWAKKALRILGRSICDLT